MTQRQLAIRISKEHTAKKLMQKGFDTKADQEPGVQLALVKEIFYGLETRYFGGRLITRNLIDYRITHSQNRGSRVVNYS